MKSIKTINKISFFLIIFCLFQIKGNAQNLILEKYINQAIESNSVLKQKQLSYEKSLMALKEAKQMFYPTAAKLDIFSGGQTKNKVKQAKIDKLITIEKKKVIENNISLEVEMLIIM